MYAIMFARLVVCTLLLLIGSLLFELSANAQQDNSANAILRAWLASPHANKQSESFTHWNTEGEVPTSCATCHSGPGFMDFLGADGSVAGVVDHPAPIESPIDCAACHNDAATALDSVTFPSGETVSELGSSAVCMVCHQGRASTDQVETALASLEDDVISTDLTFLNVHYRAAAATLLGGTVRGGYQYEGKTYAERFVHVEQFDTCTDCHNPHSLEVAVNLCVTCHKVDDPKAIRITPADVDADGDTAEGYAGEIQTLHEALAAAVQLYASEVIGKPVAYSEHTYPYFFGDTNENGISDPDEAAFPNRYQSWTPRLLKAAYNYQFIAKDPGAYTHNPRYAAQLLIDSIESLAEKMTVDTSGFTRP